MSFKSLNLNEDILNAAESMGFGEPTPIQREAIPPALEGRDVIGCAQTGTGKTVAFVFPIMQRISEKPGIKSLVVTPTRELAAQIEAVATETGRLTGHTVAAVYGGVPYATQEKKLDEVPDVLIATPGRLLDFVKRRRIDLRSVEILVLDEADRMLDMGFWPDVQKIINLVPERRQNLLFSATMSAAILGVIRHTLTDPVSVEIGRRAQPADSVEQTVYPVDSMQKLELLTAMLHQDELNKVLVFCRTRRRADHICLVLQREHVAIAAIHSDLNQSQREKTLAGFKSGKIRVLVATDIVARGIDVRHVSHVINYDVPENPEDYVHRIGRTARAKAVGKAITFLSPEELVLLRQIETLIGSSLPCADLEGFQYTTRYIPKSIEPAARMPRKLVYNGGARKLSTRRTRRR